jgi:hypothetical protein
MTRSMNSTLLAALNQPTISGLVYLLRITLADATILRYAETKLETTDYDGYVWSPCLLNISSLPNESSDSSAVEFTIANVNNDITDAELAQSFLGAKVELLEYVGSNKLAHVKWLGYADDIYEITQFTAKIVAYSGSSTTRTQVPKRTINANCPWNFGVVQTVHNTVEFDGSECQYQHTSTIGYVATLGENISTTDPLTFDVTYGDCVFDVDDEIKIDNEILRITEISTGHLTCIRGQRSTIAASHTSGATIKFSNCKYTKTSCLNRGMYGNNVNDLADDSRARNYFGGFPVVTEGLITIGNKGFEFRTVGQHMFSSNESAYGKVIPSVYGRCRIQDPVLLIADLYNGIGPEANTSFVVYLLAISDGVLACNAINGNQDTPVNAYAIAGDGLEAIYINGKRRHDPRPGYGLYVSNGYIHQPAPPLDNTTDFDTNRLSFNGIACLTIKMIEQNNSDLDAKVDSVQGDIEIMYGKLVRVYSTSSAYDFIATTNAAWVLLDTECGKRNGCGYAYDSFDLQSFVDVAAYNDGLVTSVVTGSDVKRWTFNGVVGEQKGAADWERAICLGMYCTPPFIGSDGKYKIRSLKQETLTGLPLFSSTSAVSRNIVWDEGSTPVVKRRKPFVEIPNEIRVNFLAYEGGEWVKTQVVLTDREAQTQLGKLMGTGALKVVPKTVDLVGCRTTDEAARLGTLVLRAGEFAEGGLANNLIIEFNTFYKDSSTLERGDIIQVEDALLDPVEEAYFRIIDYTDEPINIGDGGGTVFKRHLICTIHLNSIYDNTAYTCTAVSRINGPGGYGSTAPPVTDFAVTEERVEDKNGVIHSKMTFAFEYPDPTDNFRSVVILRSTTDDAGDPVGDWRVVTEIVDTTTTSIQYDITNRYEVFAAVSRNKAGHTADVDTKDATDAYLYPRVTILCDGVTDTANPSGAANLAVLQTANDASIPAGFIAIEFDRDTVAYKSITDISVIIHNGATAQGPYAVERAAHNDHTLASGTCMIVAGDTEIKNITRSANNTVLEKVFAIYGNNGNGDDVLDGNLIETEGNNAISVDKVYNKSGNYNYIILDKWWAKEETSNLAFYGFTLDQMRNKNGLKWRTPLIPCVAGSFYTTVYTRSAFGVGTRQTVQFTVASSSSTGISSFFQASIPTSLAIGDIWINSNSNNAQYRAACVGADEIKTGEWELIQDLGKITTFRQATVPTSLAVGDIWYDSSNGNKLYRAASAGADEIKTGEWILCIDSGSAAARLGLDSAGKVRLAIPRERLDYVTRGGAPVIRGASAPETGRVSGAIWHNSADGEAASMFTGPNLITYSEDFTQVVWAHWRATATPNQAAGPDGTNVLERMLETAYAELHCLYREFTGLTGDYVVSAYVRGGLGRNQVFLRSIQTIGGTTYNRYTYFYLDTCEISDQLIDGVPSTFPASIIDCGDGLYRLAMSTVTFNVSASSQQITVGPADSSGTDYMGDPTKGIYTGCIQLHKGTDLDLDYDKTTSTAHGTWVSVQDSGATRSRAGLDGNGDLRRDILSSLRIGGRSNNLAVTFGRLSENGRLINADDIEADGNSYVRVSATQRDYANRAGTGLDANGDVSREVPLSRHNNNVVDGANRARLGLNANGVITLTPGPGLITEYDNQLNFRANTTIRKWIGEQSYELLSLNGTFHGTFHGSVDAGADNVQCNAFNSNSATVGGTAVSVSGHTHDYSASNHTHAGVYAANAHNHAGDTLDVGIDTGTKDVKTANGVIAGYNFGILGSQEIINHNGQFIGSGGMNTAGVIRAANTITIGNTSLNETQLSALLALI